MDFEEQLDLFFVRKEIKPISENKCNVNKPVNYKPINRFRGKYIFNYIPLMLSHIKNLKDESWENGTNVIEIFPEKVNFRNCLVYGKIMGKGNDSKTKYNYVLDDGSGCLNISLFRRSDDIETIWKLENELQAAEKEMWAQNKDEIVNSLRKLLFQTKEQVDQSNIASGTKVLLYGRPNIYRGETSLNVFYLIRDDKTNRDVEIAFKDYLVDWYRNNCLFLTNTP